MALIFDYISRYAVLPRCGNYPGFVEGSGTFSREKEFQEYSNVRRIQLPSLFMKHKTLVLVRKQKDRKTARVSVKLSPLDWYMSS